MLDAQSLHPLRAPRSPQQRFMAVAVVASIHVAVLAAILVTLNRPFSTPRDTPITARYIPETPHKAKDEKQWRPLRFVDPSTTDTRKIEEPVVRIEDGPTDNGLTQTPHEDGGNPVATVYADARPITGTHTIPAYPPIDTRLGHEGNVMLKLSIDASGAVADAVVERSSGYDSLDKAAADWVKAHWRYAPATRNGAAIASSVEVTVAFRLTRG